GPLLRPHHRRAHGALRDPQGDRRVERHALRRRRAPGGPGEPGRLGHRGRRRARPRRRPATRHVALRRHPGPAGHQRRPAGARRGGRVQLLAPPGAARRPRQRDRDGVVSPTADPHPKGNTMEADTPALRMEAVRKTYVAGDSEVVALDCVDLTVASGEIVALVGPSGSGKTTLCSIAGGLLTATSGRVEVGGNDLSGYSERELTDFR